MTEYAFIYRGRDISGSPAQMQKQMETWTAWFKSLEAKGCLKNPGHPLDARGAVVRGNKKLVTDGPYAEAKDVVGGFTLITARGLAEAVEFSKLCPIFQVGGSVEIRPIQTLDR